MRRLALFVVRRRWLVILGGVVFIPVAGVFGGSVEQHLSSGGFSEPGAESSRATEALEQTFGTGTPNLVLLVTARDGTVDDPEVVAAGTELTEELAAEPEVSEASSYWTLPGATPLRSEDGRSALVLGRVPGNEDEVREAAETLSPQYRRDEGPIRVEVGGEGEVLRQVSTQAEEDLAKAELISLPFTLVLLLFVFGGVVAAGLPLLVAGVAVVGTFFVLRVFASFTDVSVFALNLTTAMGLGLAIDYSLFMVSRFREEVRAGRDTEAAVVRTMQTAGRTVAFSALTVAVSLAALLVFPMAYLRSFAYAGVGVVALAGVGAAVFLPAVLAALGPRVDRGRLWRRRDPEPGTGAWHRMAVSVMRRPVPFAVAVTAILIVLGIPFLHVELGLTDDRVLPESASSRQVNDAIRSRFSTREAGALNVVAPDVPDAPGRTEDIEAYAIALSGLDGVVRVDAVTGFYENGERLAPPVEELSARFEARSPSTAGATWLSVVPSVEPLSPEGEDLVHEVRGLEAPFDVLVGGQSAELVDGKDSLYGRLPLAIGIIALLTFVLLFLMVGSVLVPAKALVLNLLSLTATFGAMVWVFQDGHLSGVLDFTPTGSIDIFTPILMFCVAFGLSMDYEVFLLSRIKEEYDVSQDNEDAVAVGLERTGRIVTAAALLLALVFLAFATSQVAIVKLVGLGLALAVLVDAFLIRATLVPAFMRLAGRANWWAPAALRRFHLRWGIWEPEPLAILDLAEREARKADAESSVRR